MPTRPARQLPGSALRQQYWFSPDDSLLLVTRVIGQTPANQLPPGTQLGTIWSYGASLFDALTATAIGGEQTFASLNLLADVKEMDAEARNMHFNMNQDTSFSDPDPDPNAPAAAIADIYKVELLRDATGALRVEGTYRILNGTLDGTSFEQELGGHPNNFGKFVLPVH